VIKSISLTDKQTYVHTEFFLKFYLGSLILDNKKALCEEKEYYFGHSASPSSIHHKHKLQVQYCFSPLAPKIDSKCSNEALTDDEICKPKINGKIAAITNNCIDKICKPKLSCKCSNAAMTDR
jgi:hypothetical protein